MKKLLGISTIAFLALSGEGFAASTVGNAQATLLSPLTITENTILNYGSIGLNGADVITMDPDAGAALSQTGSSSIAASGTSGEFLVTGVASTNVSVDITGQTATLSDGSGNTLSFDPALNGGGDTYATALDGTGNLTVYVGGDLTIAGTEAAGVYSTINAGGSTYTITINY